MNDPKMLRRLDAEPNIWRIAFAAASCLVLAMSLLPLRAFSSTILVSDKFEHFTAYGLLAWLAAMAWRRNAQILIVATGLVLLAGAIEVLQIWIPGRSTEWLDLLASAAGVIAGMAFRAPRSSPAPG